MSTSSKTSAGRTEAALLVADAINVEMLVVWLKVIEGVFDDAVVLAFPDFDGKPMTHPERKMDYASRSLGHTLPTSTTFQKKFEKDRKGKQALSHFMSAARQYYQVPTLQDTFAYYAIESIMKCVRATSPCLEEMQIEDKQFGSEEEQIRGL